MLRLYFEKELLDLSDDLISIWRSVLGQYTITLEHPTEKQCQEIIKSDTKINEAVLRLDEKCQEIICLQHPVTDDLRRIVTIMKLNTDIERMGDRVVDVARVLMRTSICENWQEMVDEVTVLQLAVRDQLNKALVLYQNLHGGKQTSFELRRTEILEYGNSLEKKIIHRLSSGSDNLELGVGLLELLQYLDKMSHLIGSIYKWMSYQKTGKIV